MVAYYSRYNRLPTVFPGEGTGALCDNVLRAIEVPDIFRVGIGPAHIERMYGATAGTYAPGWGIGEYDTDLDVYRETRTPSEASEVISWIDVQRSILINPTTLDNVWEVAGFALPGNSVGVIERIETYLRIEALSPTGAVLATATVDGSRSWREEYVHPTPGVSPLRWVWSLSYRELPPRPYCGTPTAGYDGPLPGVWPVGRALLPPWCDARYGTATQHHTSQIICPARSRVRLSCHLTGGAQYRVRVVGRLIGYKQSGGRRNAALTSAVFRN